nr:MAG TPA_asm: hypothetical protein [Caudoviricetes sp.]
MRVVRSRNRLDASGREFDSRMRNTPKSKYA